MSSRAGERAPMYRQRLVNNAALAAVGLALPLALRRSRSARLGFQADWASGVTAPLTTGALYTNAFVPAGSAYVPPQQT